MLDNMKYKILYLFRTLRKVKSFEKYEAFKACFCHGSYSSNTHGINRQLYNNSSLYSTWPDKCKFDKIIYMIMALKAIGLCVVKRCKT